MVLYTDDVHTTRANKEIQISTLHIGTIFIYEEDNSMFKTLSLFIFPQISNIPFLSRQVRKTALAPDAAPALVGQLIGTGRVGCMYEWISSVCMSGPD